MSNPVVLITGALTGIGRASAIAFAKDGAHLVISGRHDAPGVQVHHTLRWRRSTGPLVRMNTIEPGCRFSRGAPG